MAMTGVIIEKWAAWQATPEAPKPDVSFVPPLARRRLTGVERAALAVAKAVYPDPPPEEGLPVVFASRWGEIGTTIDLMRQFHADGEMSPAGFSVSVHNAAPGAFSLFTRNRAGYTAIAARRRTLSSGFLEALAQRTRTLFVYAEEATPEFYRPAFGPAQEAVAVAVLMDSSAWRWTGNPLPPTCTFAEFVSHLPTSSPSHLPTFSFLAK